MKPKKRQKLCHNCEGEIDLDVIVCPFCAADLREVKPEQQMRGPGAMARPLGSPPHSPYALPSTVEEVEVALPSSQQGSAEEGSPWWRMAGSILLFALGVQIFLLGVLLLLFSHNGTLLLKWDARLWFLYLFASVPFLIFGYRSLSKNS